MKITNDRLAVARAVRDECEWICGFYELEAIIESLPEPPDDSPATLPAPDVQAQIDDGHLPLGMCITSIAKIREDLVAARAEEREACAAYLEALAVKHYCWSHKDGYESAAAAIRARSGAKGAV